MNPLQKVIKYFAMAFAVALTIAIFSSIFGIITGVTTGLSFREKNMDVVSYEKEFHDVKSLEVECDSYSVTIQAGVDLRRHRHRLQIGWIGHHLQFVMLGERLFQRLES